MRTPDRTNSERVETALSGLRTAYGKSAVKHDLESAVIDALTDLRHLCRTGSLCFPELVETATAHFHEEEQNP